MTRYEDVNNLASRPERVKNSVLTLYLNVDQSLQPNLNRGFETTFRNLQSAVRRTIKGEDELKLFDMAAAQVAKFVAGYQANRRVLVVVFDAVDGFLWTQDFDFPIASALRWGREAFVERLAAALAEHESVAIALIDRAKLRLFLMILGDLHEHAEQAFDRKGVRHPRTAGMDMIGAASHADQKADEHVRRNLRQMAAQIAKSMADAGIRRLILAGSPEVTAELGSLLPKRLAANIVGRVDIAITATPAQIRAALSSILEQLKIESDNGVVNELTTAAAKAGPVVVGCARTLHALNESRVWRLVYAAGFHSPGYECSECGAIFSTRVARCPACAATVRRADDIIERAVDHAMRKGAKVEVIRGEEAESALLNAGGIGAFLRTRRRVARAS